MSPKILFRTFACCLLTFAFASAAARAQETGGLEVPEITVTGTRVIKLPPARKGEVVDSSVYVLPAGDSLLFGSRISNFGGPGGTLPAYREFESPTSAHAEASFGTYLSPRVMAHGEYNARTLDVMGTVDYRATAGHVDSAESSSLLLDVRGALLFGSDDPEAPRVRITAGVDRIGDGYYLFGNRLTPFDRSRIATRASAELQSATDGLIDYNIFFRMEHVSVEDAIGDSTQTATAGTPGFGFGLAIGNDTTFRVRAGVDYQISSLRYGGSATTPNWVAARADLEYHPSPSLQLMGGLIYSGGQFSDSIARTSKLIQPRLSARLQATRALSLFAWYAPELRAPSYRNRIMSSPYVDRRMVLRPEYVPINIAGGVRLAGEAITLEGRVRFETAENTPVVVADSAIVGLLRYEHVESRTLALRGSVETEILSSIGLLAEAEMRSAVDESTDEQLPMVPQIDVRVRADYGLSDAIGLFGAVRFESAQRVSLGEDAREIPSRLLLDAGASFRLSDAIGLFGEVTNLLGAGGSLWDGYVAPGLEARAGARITF